MRPHNTNYRQFDASILDFTKEKQFFANYYLCQCVS